MGKIKSIVGVFKKINNFKEVFKFINVLGDIMQYAATKFEELEKELD